MTLTDRLVSSRKKRSMSQAELAAKVGLHTNALGRYERGEAIPSVEIASKIAQALEVSLDYLVGLTDVELNPDTLQRIEEIDSLTHNDQEHVYRVLDALIRDAKAKK